MNQPTDSQLEYIEKIEHLLLIEFNGRTKQEAFL